MTPALQKAWDILMVMSASWDDNDRNKNSLYVADLPDTARVLRLLSLEHNLTIHTQGNGETRFHTEKTQSLQLKNYQ